MKAVLVSKRFNPGHFSHLEANEKLLLEMKYDVYYDIHRHFYNFINISNMKKTFYFFDYFKLKKNNIVIFWFPSISIILLGAIVKLFTKATIVYIYHEPYTSLRSYRKAGFSRLKTVRIALISIVNFLICTLSDKIILPSKRAFDAIPNAKSRPHRYAKINLMFADEAGHPPLLSDRQFISYIGTIAEDHAFDDFIRLMQCCISKELISKYNFLIATRSKIPKSYQSLIDKCLLSGRLFLKCGSSMSNDEINEYYSKSFIIWNAYRRSMQSGVLPKAYMFGTPLLVSYNNQSEYFTTGIHGMLIPNRCNVDKFIDAVITIECNWIDMSKNCRNEYLQQFDYQSLINIFSDFVLDL